MKLSVVIPAKDEEECMERTLTELVQALRGRGVCFEVVVVDDGSQDCTRAVVERLAAAHPEMRLTVNRDRHGFGLAVRAGLEHCSGDAVAVMMADGSDAPEDLLRYWDKLSEGYECVFGSRFIRGARVIGYPAHKLILNRLANWFIRILFGLRYNDVTNAFKCCRREAIEGMQPLISPHFNLTVEMPLKAIVRGYFY